LPKREGVLSRDRSEPGWKTVTSRPATTYTPAPAAERQGVGLCLSGGGFRATLFHLGALRRLNELEILGQLRSVTSVSGGSIAAAHLATVLAQLPQPPSGPLPDWDALVSGPLRAFTAHDRRTGPILRRLLPWNWLKASTGVEALTQGYERDLTRLRLRDLPVRPNFVLCATDMAYGVNWTFERGRVGDWQVGYVSPDAAWPLARAVAASSCFPPVFNPLPIRIGAQQFVGGAAAADPQYSAVLKDLRLTDGGDYDNLGLEPVWKNHAIVLVSDGGAPFAASEDRGLLWRVERYSEILASQAHALRLRWLIAGFVAGQMGGTYWGVKSATTSFDPTATIGYSKALATEVIARIRTDLDAFSSAEAAVLENHGYLLAETAIRRHTPALLPEQVPAASVPHPEWMDEAKVREALRDSGKRKLFRRAAVQGVVS
jgi:NTE family protein